MLSVKSMMRSALAVGGAAVLLASGASAAVAAPAVFSTTGAPVLQAPTTNPITLSYGALPFQTRTCTPYASSLSALTSNTAGQGSLDQLYFPQGSLLCKDGLNYSFLTTMSWTGSALANKSGGNYSLTSPYLNIRDPNWVGLISVPTAGSFTVPYTNGTTGINGANPSTITFSNTIIGYVRDNFHPGGTPSMPVRMTGTLKIGYATPLTLS
jgi:hypothetical protein